MALTEVYQGRSSEKNTQGITTTISYVGTKAECDDWVATHSINVTTDANGKLVSATVDQYGGSIYRLTTKYLNANGDSGIGYATTPPDYTYGKYSASLDGSMLSTPLEQHPSYLQNWNHYLIARYHVSAAPPTTPAWWSTAGVADVIPSADQDTFRWSDSPSLPTEQDYVWTVLENPTLPGITSYDVAQYTQTESARFRSYADACASVKAKLNTVVSTPSVDPGFVGGNWKVDRATIAWTGDYWLATLTYTYSADGWNSTLYPQT